MPRDAKRTNIGSRSSVGGRALPDVQDRGDEQVPEHRDHRHRDDLEYPVVDRLNGVEQIGHGDDADQRSRLDHADQLIAGRRHDGLHRLRNDDAPQNACIVISDILSQPLIVAAMQQTVTLLEPKGSPWLHDSGFQAMKIHDRQQPGGGNAAGMVKDSGDVQHSAIIGRDR